MVILEGFDNNYASESNRKKSKSVDKEVSYW